MDIKELMDVIKDRAVVGAGGAGFPTYAKMDKKTDVIILNCAECEPLLKVHRQLLEQYSYEIMDALSLIAKVLEVNQTIVAVKKNYTKTIEAVKANLASFPDLEYKLLPEVYPMGDEVVLIYEVLGKVVPPGSIPLEVGVVVFNVETILNVYHAIHDQEPVITKYLTVAGAVKQPVTVKVPVGMSVKEVVELAGGSTEQEPSYIMGGPMTGNIVSAFEPVTKTTNAILVLPKEHNIILRRQSNSSINMKRAMASCCQCEMCSDLCPRYLLGQPITPHLFMRAATSGTTKDLSPFLDTMFCCSCGVCEMFACPQGLAPRTLITEYKNGLRKKGIAIPKGIPLKDVNPRRNQRLVPMGRLVARLGLSQYNIEAPLQEETAYTKQVKIKLNQHIGAFAVPTVQKKDYVKQGDVIAQAPKDKLSVPVHASISGEVLEVNEQFIIIKVND
jgi:Na+-translocating ferredoxin:NAD+ oxidoreductase RnfC subunit